MYENYICIDLGTSKIKYSLINSKGNLLYYCKKDAKTYYSNVIYQKPEEYLDAVEEGIQTIKNFLPNEFKSVSSLIVSGQMGGVLGIDEDFNVVFPWTYSVDTKYNKYLFSIEKEFGKEIRKSSGGTPTIAAKIVWIKNDFPDKYKKIKKFINLMSYVTCKLCDISYQSAYIDCSCLTMTGIANIKNLIWNEKLCKVLDIDLTKLPIIRRASELVGIIDKSKYGTDNDIKVLAGCGDQVAGFIGAGINKKNDLIDVSGTYTILGYCTDEYRPDLEDNILHTINTGISDIYYQIAIITAGGYTYEWFLRNFKYTKNQVIDLEGNKEKDKIYFIPHLGGRYGPPQPYFRGGWIGVTWEHDINDFYIAILESLGYEFFIALDAVKKINKLSSDVFKKINVIGGGSMNDTENEIKSNILGLRYIRLNNLPYELLGSFLIASYKDNVRLGHKKLLESGAIKYEKDYFPNESKQRYYSSFVKKYSVVIEKISQLYLEIK